MSTELDQILRSITSLKTDLSDQISQQSSQISQQSSQISQQSSQISELKSSQEILHVKLDRIEANTVTIMGAVISDFSNILPSTKAAIESAGALACADEDLIEEVEGIKTDQPVQVRRKSGKFGNKKYPFVNLKDVVAEVGELDSHPRAVGNFLSKIMTKAFGVRFNTQKYPAAALPLLTALTVYYETERTASHKY